MSKNPKEFEYRLPDGYTMEPKFREKLDALVLECDLDNEQAQKFVDLHIELTEDFVTRFMEDLAAQAAGVRVGETSGLTTLPDGA